MDGVPIKAMVAMLFLRLKRLIFSSFGNASCSKWVVHYDSMQLNSFLLGNMNKKNKLYIE